MKVGQYTFMSNSSARTAPARISAEASDITVCAGAVRALEFDMNVYWPTFNYYRLPGARSPVKYLPNSQHPGITRYLTSDDRDFFAVYTRDETGNFTTPFK